MEINKLGYGSFTSLIKDNFTYINKDNIDSKIELFDELLVLFLKTANYNDFDYLSHITKIKSLLEKRTSALRDHKKLNEEEIVDNNTELICKCLEVNLEGTFLSCTNYSSFYVYEGKELATFNDHLDFKFDNAKVINKVYDIIGIKLDMSYLSLECQIFVLCSLFTNKNFGREKYNGNTSLDIIHWYCYNKINYKKDETCKSIPDEDMEIRNCLSKRLGEYEFYQPDCDNIYYAYSFLQDNDKEILKNYFSIISDEYIEYNFIYMLYSYRYFKKLDSKNEFYVYVSYDSSYMYNRIDFTITNIEESIRELQEIFRKNLSRYITSNSKSKKLIKKFLGEELSDLEELESLFDAKKVKQVKMEIKLKR